MNKLERELLAEWGDHAFDEQAKNKSDEREAFLTNSSLSGGPGHDSPLDRISRFSITGKSEEMRQQMLDDVFVLKSLAILGQWTVFYASPNTGKTLLTLWLLRESILSGDIDGEMLFYVNADDGYRGLVEKTELAEEWGMHMLAPHQNQLKPDDIVDLMRSFAEDGSASGVVIILDTLKKFTDLMDKRASSKFGQLSREFVSAGGTLICLAHTNKNKDSTGNSIYSGTSDIVDDSDCVFILDRVSAEDEQNVTVDFRNIKARGDTAKTQGFTYHRHKGQTYKELLETVKRLDKEQVAISKLHTEAHQKLEDDAEVIEAVCSAIYSGITSKDKLIKAVRLSTGISTRRVKKVIEARTGGMYALGDRWTCKTGEHNRQTYSVLAADGPTL